MTCHSRTDTKRIRRKSGYNLHVEKVCRFRVNINSVNNIREKINSRLTSVNKCLSNLNTGLKKNIEKRILHTCEIRSITNGNHRDPIHFKNNELRKMYDPLHDLEIA